MGEPSQIAFDREVYHIKSRTQASVNLRANHFYIPLRRTLQRCRRLVVTSSHHDTSVKVISNNTHDYPRLAFCFIGCVVATTASLRCSVHFVEGQARGPRTHSGPGRFWALSQVAVVVSSSKLRRHRFRVKYPRNQVPLKA